MFIKTIKSEKDEKDMLDYGRGYIIGMSTVDYIIGKVLTIIDTLGLADRQDKSVKDLIKQAIRDEFNYENIVDSKLHTLIEEMRMEIRNEERKRMVNDGASTVPLRGINVEYELTCKENVSNVEDSLVEPKEPQE